MSRSGYHDDLDTLELGRYRAQVASAIRGKRGQRLLRDLLKALDTMPDKRLIAHELEDADGEVCALGAAGRYRGVNMAELDPDEPEDVAAAFDVAQQLAREVTYINDECGVGRYVGGKWESETPEQRWDRVRRWVVQQIHASSQEK